jgi:biotin operon repressor
MQKARKNSVDIGKIMALRGAGWSLNRIADDMGMSKQSVWNVIDRWKKAHGTGGDMDAGTEEQMKG